MVRMEEVHVIKMHIVQIQMEVILVIVKQGFMEKD